MNHAIRARLAALLMLGWALPALAQDAPPPETPAEEPTVPPPAATATPSPEPSAAEEEAEIAAELARIQARQSPEAGASSSPAAEAVPLGATPSGGGSSRGLSNLMNPAMSANSLFLGGGTTRRPADRASDWGELRSGLAVQEVEIVASAIVDPYFRADVTLAGDTQEVGFEEAYLTTLEIPRLTLRVGQMHAALGRHNLLHTHAYPFLTAPQPWRALLGDEGLVDPGVSADLLLPLPFFAEINAQVFAGEWGPFEGGVQDDPTTPFDESQPDLRRDEDLATLGHVKTLFELSDSATVEVGGTYLGGRNGWAGWSHVVGGDLTLKWRPVEAERYRGIDWTTEVLWVKRGDAPGRQSDPSGGGYTSLRAQFAQQFWVQARGSVLGIPRGAQDRVIRGEALFAFIPSEFSALRLQYAVERTAGHPRVVHEVFAQTIFSIGPHPSHSY